MFLSVKEIAEKWGLSPRRITQLCVSGEIDGAIREGRFWKIPDDAAIPNVVKKSVNPISKVRPRTTKLLPCPIGITSYKEAVAECYYVDKTLFIKDILDDHNKVYLFTRPRRFGKTLMMDMVKTYFEQSAENTSVYFNDQKIWSIEDTYKEYQGKYPVIFISFKDAHYLDWKSMFEGLRFAIKKEFRRHSELLDSEKLSEIEKNYFRKVLNTEVSEIDCQVSLGELSYMLSAHYGRKTIIIIDEYDTPIQQGYLNGYYEQVTSFIRNLFSVALKDNDHLEFGILTGILRIAKESLFSGLNNLVVNTILDEKYSTYFGFTEQEVKEIADYYGKEESVQEIKQWYDGYLFGMQEVYNPWSVLNYFSNAAKAKAYWSRTSSNDVISQLIKEGNNELYESLENLMNGKQVQAMIDTDIIYPEIGGETDTVYSFLLMAGYVKITDIVSELFDRPICNLEIPNLEIKSVFQKEIIGNWDHVFTGSILKNFEMSLRTKNEKLFQETISKFLLNCASSFDTAQETFYHGMILGMSAILSNSYYVKSNRESGEGRFDIELEPMNKNATGYILELKVGKNLNDIQLEKMAIKALEQIQDRKYCTALTEKGITNIVTYGVAFSGKNACVKSGKLVV